MANQPGYHLYGWNAYDWATMPGSYNNTVLNAPTAGSITRTSAVITVNRTDYAAQHRVLLGPQSDGFNVRTPVFADPTPASAVTVTVRDLLPNTRYYYIDIATPLGPFPNGGDLSGVPLVSATNYFPTLP